MDVIKRIIDALPFPIIIAIGVVLLSAWILKQYHGWENYQNVFQNRIFVVVIIFSLFNIGAYYATIFSLKYIEVERRVNLIEPLKIGISDFVGAAELGTGIAYEIEEALISKIEQERLPITVSEGIVKVTIDGHLAAEAFAKKNAVDLVVWGKLVKYDKNSFKIFPKLYIANSPENIRLQGRGLGASIINPSDISLREENAVDLANFVALTLGVLYFNNNMYSEAINVLESIKNKYESEARFYLGLSQYLKSSLDWDQALEHMKQAVKLNHEFGAAYLNMGMILVDIGFYQQAHQNFLKADEIAANTSDLELTAAVKSGLGLYYLADERYEMAEAHFKSSIEIYDRLGLKASIANQYGNFALAKLKQHKLEEAQEFLQKALAVHKEIKDWYGEANDLSNLGAVSRQSALYDMALKYQNHALGIYREYNYLKDVARELGNIAAIYHDQSKYSEAETLLKEQLKLFEQLQDISGKAIVLKQLGDLHLLQNQPDRAKLRLQESLALYLEIGHRAAEGEILYSLALAHKGLGEPDNAIEYLKRASQIAEELGNLKGMKSQVLVLWNMGTVYLGRHSYDEAIDTFNWALEISKQLGDEQLSGRMYLNIGDTYKEKGEMEFAEHNYQYALDIFSKLGDEEMLHLIKKRQKYTSNNDN